ncbi:MAG: NUDIX hydrolase [Cytophagales bacterium]|nr:NUDIX hydrolase [Cytophagales bacterium]
MKNPWKKLSTKFIYENPWIEVKEDKVINPSGNEGIYGTVHFKNKAIAVVPIDDEGNTYLVGQYRYPLDIYSWEIPMGGGLNADDILDSAKRELKEETGLIAKKWQNIAKIHTSNSVTDEEGFIFVATDLQQGESEPEDTEDLIVKKLPFEEAIAMTMRGEITDAISISAILKVELMRQRGEL